MYRCGRKLLNRVQRIVTKYQPFADTYFVLVCVCVCDLFPQVYLCLPNMVSLTEGHCIIAPLHHHCAATALDEDVWTEIQVRSKAFLAPPSLSLSVFHSDTDSTYERRLPTPFIPSILCLHISQDRAVGDYGGRLAGSQDKLTPTGPVCPI